MYFHQVIKCPVIATAYQPTRWLIFLSSSRKLIITKETKFKKESYCMKSTRPVAVITGAARGIGKGCALELARGGFNLLINDRPDADSVEKLHATQQ